MEELQASAFAAARKKSPARTPSESDTRIGTKMRVEWPEEGWFEGTVKRFVASSGKYEAKFEDGSLVLFSTREVDHWAEKKLPSHEGSPAKAAAGTTHAKQTGGAAPHQRPYGFIIVLMSAAMSLWLAHLGRSRRTSAFVTSVYMCLGNATMTLVGTWLSREYSWTDRLWSVTPFFYVLFFASESAFDARCTLMALLALLWSVRLTWNYARKGGGE